MNNLVGKRLPFGPLPKVYESTKTQLLTSLEQRVLLIESRKVRLLKREELVTRLGSNNNKKLTVWGCLQYLINSLESKGENGAAEILRKIGGFRAG